MDDEKQKEPEKPKEEPAADNTGKGDKFETTPIIERARQEREGLEAANKKKEELLDREEQIMAKRALGGMSEAGVPPEKPKPETDEEYTERFMKGEVNPLKGLDGTQ